MGTAEALAGDFELEMISPACLPGAAHWSAQGRLEDDISEVLPYLNSRFSRAKYDHKSKVLIMKWEGKKCAFRPNLISVAPVEDREEAHELLTRLADLVNETWRQRESLEPDYEQKPLPSVMEIYTLLPRTNCKECGYATCMAFAADLREGKTELSCCPELSLDRNAKKRQKLEELLSN
jgi:ArsR family metal-binding transcriptional regulator